MGSVRKFLRELKYRKVYSVAIAYIAVAWVLLQLASILFPTFEAPVWVMQVFTVILALGFPLAVVLAWIYDLTPQGIVKTAELASRQDAERLPAETSSKPSIVVLPFRNLSDDSSQDLFAEALGNDIVSGLTHYSELRVLSAGAASENDSVNSDTVVLGKKLGVKFLLRGSVRKSADMVRVNVQLMETRNDSQVWSETYDRTLSASNLFALQDDIRERIVSSLADYHGVIFSRQTELSLDRPTESLTAWECLSVALAYDKYPNEQNHLKARESLEQAVRLDPNYDEAWAHLSWIYTDEWLHGFNLQPEPMERALEAAQKAVKIAPNHHHNRWLLSRVYYFLGNRERFLAEVDRSLSLNANDGTTIGLLGFYVALAGQWERGLELLQKAAILNPNFPDYYYFGFGLPYLVKGEAEAALKEFNKANIPEWPTGQYLLVTASWLAGKQADAEKYRESLRKLVAGDLLAGAKTYLSRNFPFQPDLVRQILQALED